MRMFFRSFNDYEKGSFSVYSWPKHVRERDLSFDDLGKEIIYSEDAKYNSRCLNGSDHYHEVELQSFDDWKAFFKECALFSQPCSNVGFVTICSGNKVTDERCILTTDAQVNAYSELGVDNDFYIIFNARPCRAGTDDNIVTVGYDKYSFQPSCGSIIVWDLDRFANIDLPKGFMLWGIRHNTGHGFSVTDDEFVGIRNGEEIFAVSS